MKALKRILTVVSCLSLSVGLGLSVVSASAPETKLIDSVDVTAFEMYDGASIRLPDEDIGYGIRFCAGIAPATYQALEALETDTVKVNYGMVIVPADLLPEGGFTKDTLADENNHFTEEECDCGKVHYATVKYTTMASDDKTGLSVVRGSIVNIKDGNLMRPYVGIGYIEYVTANGTTYEIANGSAENARSMVYVAQLAIANGEDDANNTIYNTYVAPFADKEFGYTVNHFIPNEDGSYNETATKSEVLYGTLGEEVTATKLADYKLYSIDSSKGKVTDTLYANGKTVLNAYYVSMDTSFHNVVNDAEYFFMGVQNDLPGATTNWHDSITLNNETKEGVVQITTTKADQYTAGQFRMAFNKTYYDMAVANNYAYIKLHMYIAPVDTSVSSINFLSKNMTIVDSVETNKWVDVIVPLAKLNQYDTYLGYKGTKEAFNSAMLSSYGWNGGSDLGFLTTSSIKTSLSNLTSTDINYYVDEISWGVDTKAPEITVSGIASEMFEGTWTEPTVTVTDDLTPDRIRIAKSEYIYLPVTKTLYKIVDGERQEVALTDGSTTLDKGDYVYVVESNDLIYSDVVGNVATKEVPFKVIEKQDVVITFDSAEDSSYAQKVNKEYALTATYVDADTLASEIATIEASDIVNNPFDNGNGKNQTNNNPEETIFPEGGALKVVTGQESGQQYGCYLGFNLSDDELAIISEATSVTFRMYVAPDDLPYWTGTGEVDLRADGITNPIASFDRFTWVDVTISMDTLGANWIKYFNGTTHIFWTNYQVMNETTATLTYYINSITFDVTP